ncbi:MAG TPA: prolyl oligopeptidase family serine peptidase [Candidatus Bathyarchaeia archaeon]|nr:prolyl oligopeptidase family serine peptidase [Candidatus Bathyarchaeia archaeon]
MSRFDPTFRLSLIIMTLLVLSNMSAAMDKPGGVVKGYNGTSYQYPGARTVAVVDTLHARPVADPYRWLENTEDPEVRAWIEAENSLTRRLLDSLPGRSAIEKRLAEVLSIGTVGVPRVTGNRLFFEKRQGNENQPILYWRDGTRGEPRVLLDPNKLSAEGIVAIDWWFPSRDGRLLAYGLSKGGSEQSTLYVLDVDTGKALADSIPRTRGTSVAWLPDGSGFYYMRFPRPGDVPKGEEHFHSRILFHKLGTDPAQDAVIFGEGRDMKDWLDCDLSEDGRFLVIEVSETATKTGLFIKDLRKKDGAFIDVSGNADAHFFGQVRDEDLYIQTNNGGSNYRLFKVSAAAPARANWREIIPEGKFKLEQTVFAGHRIFASYLENAASRLYEYDLDGKLIGEIKLPGIGTVYGVDGSWSSAECFYGFTSFFTPPTVYRYDVKKSATALYDRIESSIDTSPYRVEQVWCQSKDGTKVPMFVISRKDMALDGTSPTILMGYGGFDISMTPGFSKSIIPWLEMGGVYAVANLRGGGEFGEEWHRAGMLDKKQNVFDDFIAAAEWLCAEKYTSSAHLAILGGSNGGLLVGAVVTQRPDICRAAVCAVPVLDMMRYHLFSVGRYWITEYGDPGKPEEFEFLIKYSPYHNVRDGERYPAILLTTAENDPRVDPAHAMKMAARLQSASTSGYPVLLRFETKAGHGIGAPISKIVDEYTDYLSFISWQLGMANK